jgi:hypothetical protein
MKDHVFQKKSTSIKAIKTESIKAEVVIKNSTEICNSCEVALR